jgi:carbamoyltransferase
MIKLARFDPYPQYSGPHHPHWQLMKAILGAFVEGAQGREIVVAPLPTYHYIEGLCRPTYMRRFQEFSKEYPQIHLINVLEEFWCLSRVERRACRYSRDIHYTPLAHSVVARALRKELRSRKLL